MPSDWRFGRDWASNPYDVLVGRCHALAERIVQLSPLNLLQELRGLAASIPQAPTLHEQLLGRSLVTHVLARLGRITQLEGDADVARAFFALEASDWAGDEWYRAFADACRCFEGVLAQQNDLGPGMRTIDVRMHRARRYIDSHYRDPEIRLSRVAEHAGLSPCYVARMIKRETGHGFLLHIRRRRVESARRLLDDTVLSIKEIAAKVGYGTPRQFERDFKRLVGVAPTALRGNGETAKPDGE